MMIFSTVGL